jgi:L-ascorbate metabolism protein UlaG (beta-lactamase superfamily)
MLEFGRATPPPRPVESGPPRRGEIAFRLYISGDTLVHDALRLIPARFPQVDLGLFHLGGTRVLGVLVTMDAEQGVEAIRIVRPDVAVPIHYDDYPVFRSPLQDFVDAVERAGLSRQVRYLGRGERYEFDVRRTVASAGPRAGEDAWTCSFGEDAPW